MRRRGSRPKPGSGSEPGCLKVKDKMSSRTRGTHNYYFPHPAGNILEFIAREDLPAKAGEDFRPEDILHISEIGLVVDDVPGMV